MIPAKPKEARGADGRPRLDISLGIYREAEADEIATRHEKERNGGNDTEKIRRRLQCIGHMHSTLW